LRWAKVCESYAGFNKERKFGYGKFWRPKAGDSVWVTCEAGDPAYRVVLGGLYRLSSSGESLVPFGYRTIEPFKEDETGDQDPLPDGLESEEEEAYSDESEEPHHYITKTKNGHIFSINEKEEKEQITVRSNKGHVVTMSDEPDNEFLLVQDSHGNYIYFDTDNDDLHIRVKNNMKISVGGNLKTVVEGYEVKNVADYMNYAIGTMITFSSAAMNILNAITNAIVDSWTWVGSVHTRQGGKTVDDTGNNIHK
jgi:hypothetical protein